MTTHKNLDVWKVALDLTDLVYDITATFPKDEMYGLTSQMRRYAVSVPSNIAEGCKRNNKGELIQFIDVSRGSLAELETQSIISNRRNYMNQEQFDAINSLIVSVSKFLFRWQESIKNKAA